MVKINKALVVLGMLLLAAVASAAQEAETVQQQAESAQPMPGMGMPNLNARRLNTFPLKGALFRGWPYGYYNYNPYFYGYGYGRGFNPYFNYWG